MTPKQFQAKVWLHYRNNKRAMPWRTDPNPYFVVVSEFMLQQTQVSRVTPKFVEFTLRFPSFEVLAAATLGDVLVAWNGLGYNRRAKFLWQLAGQVKHELPTTLAELTALPGIGPNTAGAILAYAYNQPIVFVETNIRTVFIHHFFADHKQVTDQQIKEKVTATLPTKNVREWYWALMDYGTFLKSTNGAQLEKVSGYKKQSRFVGSLRQVRGQVLKQLMHGPMALGDLQVTITDPRLLAVLQALEHEGLVKNSMERYSI